MSSEVFEIVKEMDMEAAETQLALQCAPLISGIKASNLLIICRESVDAIIGILQKTEISYLILSNEDKKSTLLLYHKKRLEDCCMEQRALLLLKHYGYEADTLDHMLQTFRKRYEAYQAKEINFPHEIGIFLGYPTEDVEGFIQNGGKNYLCSGCWKVYANREAKLKIFEKYEKAKETIVQLMSYGVSISDVII